MRVWSCRYGVVAVVLGILVGCDSPHEAAFTTKINGGWARRFDDVIVDPYLRSAPWVFAARGKDNAILRIDPFGSATTHPWLHRATFVRQLQHAEFAWVTAGGRKQLAENDASSPSACARIEAGDPPRQLAGCGDGFDYIEPNPAGDIVWSLECRKDDATFHRTQAGVTRDIKPRGPLAHRCAHALQPKLEVLDQPKPEVLDEFPVQGMAAMWEVYCPDPRACERKQLRLRQFARTPETTDIVADDVRWVLDAGYGPRLGMWLQTDKGLAHARVLDGRAVVRFVTTPGTSAPILLDAGRHHHAEVEVDEFDGLSFFQNTEGRVVVLHATNDQVRSWTLSKATVHDQCHVRTSDGENVWAYCSRNDAAGVEPKWRVYRLAPDGKTTQVFSTSGEFDDDLDVLPGAHGAWVRAGREVRFVPDDPASAPPRRTEWTFDDRVTSVTASPTCACAWVTSGEPDVLHFVDAMASANDWSMAFPPLTLIEATTPSGHAWLRPTESSIPTHRASSSLVAIGPAADLHVVVAIDAARFDVNRQAPVLPADNFKLALTVTVGADQVPLQLKKRVVKIVDRTAKATRITDAQESDWVPTLAWPDPPDPEHDYALELTLTSADDAIATLSIEGVRVASSFTRQAWVRTALAYFAIVLFAGLFTSLLRVVAKPAARWGMLTGSTTSGTLGAVAQASFWPSLGVHLPALAIALLATLIVLVGLGLLKPRAFNAICVHEPFAAFSHYAFYLQSFRERYIAEYLTRLTRTIDILRDKAFQEDYVRVPVMLRSGNLPVRTSTESANDRTSTDPVDDRTSTDPVDDLARLLTKGTHVLIEAPGGMGKSVLLRAVVLKLVKDRRDKPDDPIPLLCESTLPTPGGIAGRLFEKSELSTKALQVLSTTLTYVVVFDGLVESNVAPAALDELAYSPPDVPRRVRVLASTRPNPLYAKTLANCGRLTIVHLNRISENHVREFEQGCAKLLKGTVPADDKTTGVLSDTLRRHCVHKDGTYIPILIKLAVVVQQEVSSVSALYRLTLAQLLKLDPSGQDFGDQIIEAGKLCAATYWRAGLRSMAFAGAPPQHQDILKKLKTMSVVYSTEAGDHPREVRFFHDSMQSYLTAVAVTSGAPDLEFLARAAGSAQFRDGDAGAELFRMCVDLIPRGQVSTYIDHSIVQWRARFAGDLAPNAVARALDAAKLRPGPAGPDAAPPKTDAAPSKTDAAPPKADAVPPTADQLLRDALDLAQNAPIPELARLDLFEAVAPLCWPLLNRCYVDISTVPPGGQLVIDDVVVGAAPMSHPYEIGKQLVVTATLQQDGRLLRGSSVTTVQRDQAPLVITLRR